MHPLEATTKLSRAGRARADGKGYWLAGVIPAIIRRVRHTYWIDIVGTCNLRCPSCPTGNFRKTDFVAGPKPLGFMPLEKFREILAKIAREESGPARIELYNWGEPLLHPQVAAFVAAVKAYPNFTCGVSSNLSLKADLAGVIAAGVDWFRVSLSGYRAEAYAQTHRRGDIALVKENMRRLREEIDRQSAATRVEVAYHVYLHNVGADFDAMSAFCEELRFTFRPAWALFYPVEKLMSYCETDSLSEADRDTVDLLAIKPSEFLHAAQAHRAEPCRLQTQQTAINHDGTVQLCCATYDPAYVIAPDFLTTSAADLMNAKAVNSTCDRCIAGGYHAMMMYRGIEGVEGSANARIAARGARFGLRGGSLVWDEEKVPG